MTRELVRETAEEVVDTLSNIVLRATSNGQSIYLCENNLIKIQSKGLN